MDYGYDQALKQTEAWRMSATPQIKNRSLIELLKRHYFSGVVSIVCIDGLVTREKRDLQNKFIFLMNVQKVNDR